MRRITATGAAVLVGVLLSGCGRGGPLQEADAARVAALETRILEVAGAAQAECEDADNDPRVREVLDPLVREVALVPDRPEAEKLGEVAGAWQQVWSDFPTPAFEGLCISASDTYQVVLSGYYYNISDLRLGDLVLTSFLRGVYEVTPDYLPVEFTKTTYVQGPLPVGADLLELARAAERGELLELPNPPPDGAAGTRGELKNLYVDEDLRIITGRGPLEASEIFVLKRVAAVQ